MLFFLLFAQLTFSYRFDFAVSLLVCVRFFLTLQMAMRGVRSKSGLMTRAWKKELNPLLWSRASFQLKSTHEKDTYTERCTCRK
jgi:hypothetical protein